MITDLAELPAELQPEITALATEPLADLALVLVHGGGPKGKALLDRLKAAGATVVDCPPVKPWELPQFVSAEAKRLDAPIEPGAAQFLVDAVGHDLRALAAAVRQLLADSEGGRLTADQVRRYFGGRSEVTSFAVADAALAGRTGLAMEQLRWALSTGVAPVLVTSALAAGVRGLGQAGHRRRGSAGGRPGPGGRGAALEAEDHAGPGPGLGRRRAWRTRCRRSRSPTPRSRARPTTRRSRWSGWC